MSDARTRVLVVEDQLELQEAYRRFFGRRYDMAFVGTGAEAVGECERFLPDVVVLDMNLPDTDGIEVMRHVRKWRSDIPVVITTAYTSIEPMVEIMGLGHQGYLVKPFDMADLAQLIDDAG